MKKMMIALVTLLTIAATGKAMSYEQARNEALFLTDKMAYELNLTDEQYEAAYEINLDYLMGVTSYDDVYGPYWEHRNTDLSYILLEWQWNAFCAAAYFFRPLYWSDGFWHFAIYARYPHRDYFFFGRPVFYASYRGGHAWHIVGGHGYYYGRRDHFRPAAGRTHFGMLDRWNRGDFRGGRHEHHNGSHAGHGSHFGGNRNSSTRTTVNGGQHHSTHQGNNNNHNGHHSLGGSHSGGSFSGGSSTHSGGSSTNSGGTGTHSGGTSAHSGGTGTHSGGTSAHSGSLGGSRSSGASAHSGSLGGSRSSGSFSGGSRSGSGASRSSGAGRIGSGASRSGGAGRSSGGDHSYGGRR